MGLCCSSLNLVYNSSDYEELKWESESEYEELNLVHFSLIGKLILLTTFRFRRRKALFLDLEPFLLDFEIES